MNEELKLGQVVEVGSSSPVHANGYNVGVEMESSKPNNNKMSKRKAEVLKLGLEVEVESPSPAQVNGDNMSKRKTKELKLEVEVESPSLVQANGDDMSKRKAEEPNLELDSSSLENGSNTSKQNTLNPCLPQVEVGSSIPLHASSDNTSKRKAEESPTTSKKKKSKTLPGMRANDLLKILETDPIKFCQDMGLMAKAVKCPCGADMNLVKCQREIARWRCDKNGQGHHQSVRKGTWFEKGKVTPGDILYVAYMWLHEYSLSSMLHESNMKREKTLREWCGSCLDLCQAILEHKRDPLGGDGKTVEIYQCSFKQKKEKCKKWVFCALEQNSTKSLLIYSEDKASETVAQIFRQYFLPGTTVVGRVWTFYESMTESDFLSLTKERSLTFFDFVTKVKMDTFREFEKKTQHLRPALSKLKLDECFYEKMYRKSLAFAPDAYVAFLKDVSLIYIPAVVVVKNSSKGVKCKKKIIYK